ncbi:MAG: S1 RNA-binding domain-containing protein [Candidatus Micrarchaeia archaeon]
MLVQKELPEVGELVIIKIKKIMPFGAYCEVVEYNLDAYLPIKEIAPGWIKNIHEFIREGQQRVAKVIFVDTEKKALDLSLKKVSKKEEKDKIGAYNLEIRAEKLFDQALFTIKKTQQKEKLKNELSKQFKTYSELIEAVLNGKTIENVGKDFNEVFVEIVKKNIKPKKYIVNYIAEIIVYDTENGIDIIKKALVETASTGVNIIYMGAPHYKLSAEDIDYHSAETKIKNAENIIKNAIGQHGVMTLQREKSGLNEKF